LILHLFFLPAAAPIFISVTPETTTSSIVSNEIGREARPEGIGLSVSLFCLSAIAESMKLTSVATVSTVSFVFIVAIVIKVVAVEVVDVEGEGV